MLLQAERNERQKERKEWHQMLQKERKEWHQMLQKLAEERQEFKLMYTELRKLLTEAKGTLSPGNQPPTC